jgi:hypothetical protein
MGSGMIDCEQRLSFFKRADFFTTKTQRHEVEPK